MAITVEAVYEGGVLRPTQPLPLKEHEQVRVTVHTEKSPILEAYGIMGFKGTVEEAEYFAMDDELNPEEDE
jgi:predicted DNA-binding antitoxin AbrB/MazE fold protein